MASTSIQQYRGPSAAETSAAPRIRPCTSNHWYWSYKDERPCLLIGGSVTDNLFQIDNLEEHLDELAGCGGNYVRNTMSSRKDGNLWPYRRVGERFDLEQWNDAYWERFDHFLRLCCERDIIVQLEIWDPHDHHKHNKTLKQSGWRFQPFNPPNNVNYTAQESRLPTEIHFVPTAQPSTHAFFHTVPALDNNELVLRHQTAFVDRVLETGFEYPNVLYCMNNEIGEPVQWGEYWARHVHHRAAQRGIRVQVTDMRRNNDVHSEDHRYLQDRPAVYTYLDVSQNNGRYDPWMWTDPDRTHWEPIVRLRQRLAGSPRPLNNTKIYGQIDGPAWGGQVQGLQKFWRNLFAGCASVRFHRPTSGLGLMPRAQAHIRAARMLAEAFDLPAAQADDRHELLRGRTQGQSYLRYRPGRQYAVYFAQPDAVGLDLSQQSGGFSLRWLEIEAGLWHDGGLVEAGGVVRLDVPAARGQWIALLAKA